MSKPLQTFLNWVYKKFSNDAPKMIITTSIIGWTLSMLAQVLAIGVNPKIKEEQKVFLIPQEINDALVNICSFLIITLPTKTTVSNMFATGKFAPKSVREYLQKNQKLYADKIGKLDFNLEEVLRKNKPELVDKFLTYKNFGTTVATVGAGIIAANIVTPLIRNKMASKFQKTYINEIKTINKEGETSTQNNNAVVKKQEVHSVPKPQISNMQSGGSMRI